MKKKTRRGSRGGKNRRKRAAAGTGAAALAAPAAPSENGAEPASEPTLEPEPLADTSAAEQEEWGYVPMAEWGDEFQS